MLENSQIIRVSTGYLNTVSDTYIGGAPSLASSGSLYAGQLGKVVRYNAEEIAPMFKSSVGTLYGGEYRYVRRRATDDASPALGVGKLAFIDTVVSNWQTAFQVTTDENLSSTSNAIMIAGVFIGTIDPGEYGFIQIVGEVYVRFRSVLTTAGAPGSPCYAAAAGDTGSDQGTVDCLTTDSTALANARYLGNAVDTPVGGALKRILLNVKNPWL